MSFKQQFASRIEDDSTAERSLMCKAHECPNRWSVSISMLCSAHAWADPHEWHDITTQQLQLFAARTAVNNAPALRPVATMSNAQKTAALRKLLDIAKNGQSDYKAWARKLKQREQIGDRLNSVQRLMWREALHEHD